MIAKLLHKLLCKNLPKENIEKPVIPTCDHVVKLAKKKKYPARMKTTKPLPFLKIGTIFRFKDDGHEGYYFYQFENRVHVYDVDTVLSSGFFANPKPGEKVAWYD